MLTGTLSCLGARSSYKCFTLHSRDGLYGDQHRVYSTCMDITLVV